MNNSNRVYATGKRKTSVARVWVSPGKGIIYVNKKKVDEYFVRDANVKQVSKAFDITNTSGQYDVFSTVKGGGLSAQAEALMYGVAKALNIQDPTSFHHVLKNSGYLTRDSRIVERKKYGRHGARKSTQFSKR